MSAALTPWNKGLDTDSIHKVYSAASKQDVADFPILNKFYAVLFRLVHGIKQQ